MMKYDISFVVDGQHRSYHNASYWFQEGWLFIQFSEKQRNHVHAYRSDQIRDWTMVESER